MRSLAAVLVGLALGAVMIPAVANEPDVTASVPPQSVVLPAHSHVSNMSVHHHVESSSEEEIIHCQPSPVTAGHHTDSSGTKVTSAAKKKAASTSSANNKIIAQGNTKIAYEHQSPPPAAGVGKKIQVRAYAYCIHGRTASGAPTKLGTIAVDRKLIPLGSKIYVPGYGWGTAQDTGGHMRGKVIDIWYPSFYQCQQWGSRNVTITVLPK